MYNLWNLFIILLLVVICVSQESGEREYEPGVPINGNMEIYRYYVDQPDYEEDSSSAEVYPLKKKRDVATEVPVEKTASTDGSEPPKVLLTDLIGKVEGSIVQSAMNIAQLLKGSKNNSVVSTTPSVKEESETESKKVKRSAESLNEAVPANKDTVVRYVTTKKLSAEPNETPHVAVDHISVSDAKGGLGPLFSSLDFIVKEAPKLVANTAAGKPTDGAKKDGAISDLTVVTPTTPSTKNSPASSSTEAASSKTSEPGSSPATSGTHSAVSAASTSASTTALPDSIASPSTQQTSVSSDATSAASAASSTTKTTTTAATTKNPIEQLKEAEDDLKEKVAEIEAEPIILSARV